MASEMRNNAMVDDDMTEEGVEIERVPSPADDDCSNSPEKFPVAPLPEEIPLPLPTPMPLALRSLISSNSGGQKLQKGRPYNNLLLDDMDQAQRLISRMGLEGLRLWGPTQICEACIH